ncbi:AAA family ATPase [Micromonospora sp. NPDC050276]|uniref:AAA family ATPase n=1 Tax=Micromonospora sp. NPDC050276 TaxID=3364278 RepID=UPI00378D1A26
MRRAIVGRDEVFDRAWHLLSRPGAVLLEGPAGIGKTELWRALVARATQAGWLVLSCAPTEAEAELPYAALADLLGPLGDRVAALPGPQRAAAEVVFLSGDAHEPVDVRVVGAATRTLLEVAAAATAHPGVLVAVDDAPWLDRPSERALHYALRRLTGLAVLVSQRHARGAPQAVPLGLDEVRDGGPAARIEIPPLDVGALHHVLRDHLGVTLTRPMLVRVAREAGGNPLLAIEVVRAVQRLPRQPALGDDLPVAASMHHLLADVLAGLPPPSRDAVRLAALLSVPTLADLRAAGVAMAALDAPEEAGLVVVTPTAVRFTHPVHAAAVRASIPPGVRRRLHRRLADLLTDPNERARHLARCTTDPDPVVADTLAAAAERWHGRGAPDLAADLHDQAAELTPPDDRFRLGQRRFAAARCRFDSGDFPAARRAAEAVALEFDGDVRAESLLLRAAVAWSGGEANRVAVDNGTRALAAARPDSALAGRIHAHLAVFEDRTESARAHAEAAAALLDGRHDDHDLLAAALVLLFFQEVRLGRAPRTDLLDRALALEGDEPSWLASTVPAIWWKSIDDAERARRRLHRMLGRAEARGDEPLQHELLSHLGEAELLAGRWDEAERHIGAARDLGDQLGTGLVGETWLAALLDAHRGRLTEASLVAEAGLRTADDLDDDWCRRIHQQLAGFVALSAGRMAEAAAAYTSLAAIIDANGLVEPLAMRFEPDWIEACVGAGDLDRAEAVLERLTARHHRLPRPWTTLGTARARALLDSAAGRDPGSALEALAAARDAVPPDVLPLDRARCLLVAGIAHRRSRRKLAARQALEAAVAEFTAIGAAAFAERAQAELARIGGRPPTPRHLTATEERVARLAARGRTNRAIADELFVSPKTVEANLARIYRKLGISTRAELGAAMSRADAEA